MASVDLAHIGVLAGSNVNKLFGFSTVDESKIDLLIKMDDGRKEHPTYPNNSKNIIKLSTNQLPEKICKMVEERVKGHVTANLDYTLACFEVDRLSAVKKIKDVSFDPLPATCSFEVKTN